MLKQKTILHYAIGLLLALPFFGAHGAAHLQEDIVLHMPHKQPVIKFPPHFCYTEAIKELFETKSTTDFLQLDSIAQQIVSVSSKDKPEVSVAQNICKKALKNALEEAFKKTCYCAPRKELFYKELKKKNWISSFLISNFSMPFVWRKVFERLLKKNFLKNLTEAGYKLDQKGDQELASLIKNFTGLYLTTVGGKVSNRMVIAATLATGAIAGYVLYKTKLPSKLLAYGKRLFSKKAVVLARR